MKTKEEIVELLNDYSGYVDRSCTDKAIHEDNFELIADAILSKLHQPTVSNSVCICKVEKRRQFEIDMNQCRYCEKNIRQTDC